MEDTDVSDIITEFFHEVFGESVNDDEGDEGVVMVTVNGDGWWWRNEWWIDVW